MQSNDVNAGAVNGGKRLPILVCRGKMLPDTQGRSRLVTDVSSQLSHDEKGNLIAPASLDESGKPDEFSMTADAGDLRQCRQAFGALRGTLDNVVEDTLYVLDVDRRLPS